MTHTPKVLSIAEGGTGTATKGDLSFLAAGIILPFGATAAPTGSLLCNGAAVSRTTYTLLFATIGTAFGSGNGSTTFNLPDLQGVTLRGVSGASGRDPNTNDRVALNPGGNIGNNIGSYQPDTFASHNHTGTTGDSGDHKHNIRSEFGTNAVPIAAPNGVYNQISSSTNYINTISIDSAGTHSHVFTTNSTGENETRMKNVYVNYIITTGF